MINKNLSWQEKERKRDAKLHEKAQKMGVKILDIRRFQKETNMSDMWMVLCIISLLDIILIGSLFVYGEYERAHDENLQIGLKIGEAIKTCQKQITNVKASNEEVYIECLDGKLVFIQQGFKGINYE